jgi:hypothetical protein
MSRGTPNASKLPFLTIEQIERIETAHRSGAKIEQIAVDFGIHQREVSAICSILKAAEDFSPQEILNRCQNTDSLQEALDTGLFPKYFQRPLSKCDSLLNLLRRRADKEGKPAPLKKEGKTVLAFSGSLIKDGDDVYIKLPSKMFQEVFK